MEPLPSLPNLADVGREAFSGNLWIHELLDAPRLRFAVDGGDLRFAVEGETRPFDGGPPPALRAAVRAVRESFELGALYEAVEQPGAYTFVCRTSTYRQLAYDWDRLPPALGTDVYDGTAERWVTPDTAARVFERLGLDTVNTFERELPARHFYPDRYDWPDSAWYDGPPAGIVVRDKNGMRARQYHPSFDPEAVVETDAHDPASFVQRYVTDERLARVADRLERQSGEPEPSFEALYEAVLDSVFRETRVTVASADGAEWRELRSLAAERVRSWLNA